MYNSGNITQLQVFWNQRVLDQFVIGTAGFTRFEVRVLPGGAASIFSLVATLLILLKEMNQGVTVAIIELLLTLTVVNPLAFFFDSFCPITAAIFQFEPFVPLWPDRNRFLKKTNETISSLTQVKTT